MSVHTHLTVDVMPPGVPPTHSWFTRIMSSEDPPTGGEREPFPNSRELRRRDPAHEDVYLGLRCRAEPTNKSFRGRRV